MGRFGRWALVAVIAGVSLGASGDASARRHGWPRPHVSGRHLAAEYRRNCLAACKQRYEIDAAGCSAMPRGHKQECRAQESLDRKSCVAGCRQR